MVGKVHHLVLLVEDIAYRVTTYVAVTFKKNSFLTLHVMYFWVTTDRNSWKVLSWSVSLSVLLRQVSLMRCGACEESTGSLFTEIFLKVRRNRKSGNPATRVLQLSRSVLSNV